MGKRLLRQQSFMSQLEDHLRKAVDIFSKAKLVCFDADGTLWYDGKEPTPGALEFIKRLRLQGTNCVVITNNSRNPSSVVRQMLAQCGFDLTDFPEGSVYCSGEFTAHYLQKLFPPNENGERPPVFVIGSPGLQAEIRKAGFTVAVPSFNSIEDFCSVPPENRPRYAAVIVGLDNEFNYIRLSEAIGAIRDNEECMFISTNSDRLFPTKGRLIPGSGVLTAAIAAGAARQPRFIGKPAPAMLEDAMKHYGLDTKKKTDLESVVMVGDRLETDILSGNELGVNTVAVLCGVTDQKTVDDAESHCVPTACIPDFQSLLDHWGSGY